MQPTQIQNRLPQWKSLFWCGLLCCAVAATPVWGQTESLARGVSGLLEPYQTVSLSSSESGVIVEIAVAEGQQVRPGDIIARLESELQETQLKIARQRMESLGELHVARAEWQMRKQRLEKLIQIRNEGHARAEEVDRAKTDLEMAIARFHSQQDELAVRKLEYLRAQQTLDRRAIRSPIGGTVSRLERKVGEFISPVRPEVAVIIQSDPLLAVFPVPIHEVDSLHLGDETIVALGGSRDVRLTGRVESIGVTIDSASQTVKVKVRLPNADQTLRVGEPCTLWKTNRSLPQTDGGFAPPPQPQGRRSQRPSPPRASQQKTLPSQPARDAARSNSVSTRTKVPQRTPSVNETEDAKSSSQARAKANSRTAKADANVGTFFAPPTSQPTSISTKKSQGAGSQPKAKMAKPRDKSDPPLVPKRSRAARPSYPQTFAPPSTDFPTP